MIDAILGVVWAFLGMTWWLWLFIILLPLAQQAILFWRQPIFKKGIVWTFMEIRIPREVTKSPRAMEQVLLAMSTLRNSPGDIREKYYDGEVTRWFALEMVSFGGEIHFYVRCRNKLKNLVRAAFFAYYRDVEVEEVEDYISRFPSSTQEMYAKGYDMWGTEMIMNKMIPNSDGKVLFPIRTYKDFEAPAEEKEFDPIAAFLEVLGNIKPEEVVGIQILIQPNDPKWSEDKEYKKSLEELKSKLSDVDAKKKLKDLEKAEDEAKKMEVLRTLSKSFMRSPGENDVIEAVERNLSKASFRTLIRFIYLAPISVYSDDFARRGLVGAFNQYSSLSLNSFRNNVQMQTRTQIWNKPHIFPKKRLEYKKQRLLWLYRNRELPEESWLGKFMFAYIFNWGSFGSQMFDMNVECLATLFHPPTVAVLTAPHVKRIDSRKAGPPAGLAIFGDDKELEKFR